jgi:diguanylate cyclase (GGDEF)-like protein/PAS domain S-box-containing protein
MLDAYAGEDTDYLRALNNWSGDLDSHGPVRAALDSGQYVVRRKSEITEQNNTWQLLMADYEFTGVIVLPLHVQDRIAGVLVLYSRKPIAFDAKEIELLLEMTADLSFGVTALRTGIERDKERTELIKLSSALKQADDIVIITDKQGVIDYVNPAFERVTGFSVEEAHGKTPGALVAGDEETRGNFTEMWQVLTRGEAYRGTFINRRKDGSLYYEQKTITPIKDDQGNINYYLSTGKDITDDLQLQERLRNLLNYDTLTGLPNRNLFLERLSQLHEQAQWEQRQLAIAIVNIDRFKIINSSLGHHIGDEVLRSIAQRLNDYFRPMNIVARLVGNTFAVILSDQTDLERIVDYTRNLLSFIATPSFVLEREIAVSACVGVAIAAFDSNDVSELLRNAEAAMYQAKQRGPNQIEFYNKSINERSANTLTLEIALRHAMERQEFILYYQPKIDLKNGRIVGVEALIRWQQPEHGLVSPAEFIPLLEQTGLIVPVGQWVLEEACRQLRAWDEAGLPPLQMGLNLSPRQFLHDGLIEDFSAFFDKHGLESVAGRLELEITESSFMHDLEHGILTLQKLKDMGLKIAIDDFGTGYSSLSYLSRLPVDVLKIDRSFINNIPERTDDVEVVRAIVALAKSLNLHVVAEGVENVAQQDFLVQQGCDLAQGYYYSTPESADKLTPYLRTSLLKH